jgi:c-di-GMP-binding flagellar brake protein YcgR
MSDTRDGDKQFVIKVLKELHAKHTPLLIHFRGVSQQFVSIILEINIEKNCIVLDEFSPKEGHDLAIKKLPFRVSSSDHGIAVVFTGVVAMAGMEPDPVKKAVAYYVVPIPTHLEYRQRRDSFRVHITSITPIRFKIQMPALDLPHIMVTDVSLTGIALSVEGNYEERIHKMDILERCTLGYEQETILDNIQIEIRFSKFDPDKNHTHLGARFLKLPVHTQRAMNTFITLLQRENRRREMRTE